GAPLLLDLHCRIAPRMPPARLAPTGQAVQRRDRPKCPRVPVLRCSNLRGSALRYSTILPPPRLRFVPLSAFRTALHQSPHHSVTTLRMHNAITSQLYSVNILLPDIFP